MGTFGIGAGTGSLWPVVSSTNGFQNGLATPGWTDNLRAGNGAYFSNISGALISPINLTFFINENSLGISLDGNPEINWNSLPAGFQIVTINLTATANMSGRVADPSNNMRIISGSYDSGPILVNPLTITNQALTVSNPESAFQFLSRKILCTSDGIINGSALLDRFNLSLVKFSGTYQIVGVSWTLENDGTLVTPGTTVIHLIAPGDSGGVGLDFTHVSQFTLEYINSSGVLQTINIPGGSVVSTSSSASITIPSTGGDTPAIINIGATGDGTQFSGSIALGEMLTIFFTDGSGIYRLVEDKTNDTLYINDTVETFNVKIPDPFIKTAFVP